MNLTSNNKDIMADWLDDPGTKLILQKLVDSADRVQKKYDKCQTYEEMLTHQIYRKVVLTQIPKVIEAIVNEGEKPPLWKFWKWLGNL